MVEPELTVRRESTLPASLPAGTATAVFCSGVCFHASERLRGVVLEVDGVRRRVAAWGMPRPDLSGDPRARAHRSGFWGTVPLPAREAGAAIELRVVARLESGAEVGAAFGAVPVVERAPAVGGTALIAVCMATFEPDPALLAVQLDSLRAQSDERWICVISDDASGEPAFSRLQAAVGDDPRFRLSRSPVRLGFYRNFERALGLAPPEAGLVALCDQDDLWHPGKLAALRAALGDATLVYSDQRLVDDRGRVLRDTLWHGRRNNHTNLASMLVANTVTGAAALMPRAIAELARPFPESPGLQFHDHWIAVVALAAGQVAYVDRPLYDYVQHGAAVLGHVRADERRRRLRVRGLFDRWRKRYFLGYLAREVQAQAALARCGDRLTAGKRAALERFVGAQRSPLAFAWLVLRAPLRELTGRNETLGTELELAQGVLWRRLIGLRARLPRRRPLDARYPTPQGFDDLGFEQRRLRRWRASVQTPADG